VNEGGYWEVVRDYLERLVPPRPAELQTMERFARETRFPIVGPAAGAFLYLIARLMRARRVFEMGSGYGYSTAWFARAVQENGGGEVFHVVWDEELSSRARRHLATLGLDDVIRYVVGEATAVLSETDGSFDLIFNDIDKEGYPHSLPVVARKLRSGGLLVVDNMLWTGRVFDPEDRSASTEGVREFTHRITTDQDWITSLVPIRDGLMLALKR
jgi:caffeoyl-CoA O-methyltransferase